MANVVHLTGQRPGGWAKDRWRWISSIVADARLLPIARLVAVSLAQGFANHENAECRPGLAALTKAVGASRATVLRALADLQAQGWLERQGGNAPGKAASYAFRFPDQVSPVRPEQVSPVEATGLTCEKSPCTPYKDKPHMNHNARGAGDAPVNPRAALRGLPMPPCVTVPVPAGSGAAARWDAWLASHGFPPLERIGKAVTGVDGASCWQMPLTVAPDPGDPIPYDIARKWAAWLRSRA